MAERLETLARVLERMNTRLAPAPLRRLDRWLLTHRPLVWHTRLHWIACWSLLATLAMAGLGAWTQGSCANAWTGASLAGTTLTIRYVTMVVGVCWAVLQLRRRVGELPIVRHVALGALNAVAVVLLCLPSHSLSLTATYRMARSISDVDLQRELAFHKDYQFWDCSAWLTQESVDEHWPQLEPSLHKFGLRSDKTLEACPAGAHALVIRDSDGARSSGLLEQRLASIWSSKQLWRSGKGEYAGRHRHGMFGGVLFGLIVAVILGVASHPAYAWRRSLLKIDLPGLPFVSRRRRWKWLARFDHWLLLRSPLLWATRAHLLLVDGLTVVLVVSGLLWLALWAIDSAHDTRIARTMLSWFAAIWPFLWLVFRRHDLAEAAPRRSRAVVGTFLLALAPGPLMVATRAFDHLASDWLTSLAYQMVCVVFIVGVSAIRTYRNRLSTFLFSAIGFIAPTILFGLAVTGPVSPAVSLVLFVVFWMRARSRASAPKVGARLISFLIVMTPGALVMAGVLVVQVGSLPRIEMPDGPIVVLACLFLVTGAVLYFSVIASLLAALARVERQPQPE